MCCQAGVLHTKDKYGSYENHALCACHAYLHNVKHNRTDAKRRHLTLLHLRNTPNTKGDLSIGMLPSRLS